MGTATTTLPPKTEMEHHTHAPHKPQMPGRDDSKKKHGCLWYALIVLLAILGLGIILNFIF